MSAVADDLIAIAVVDKARGYWSSVLRRLDAGSWFNRKHRLRARERYAGARIPLLAEVLQWVKARGCLAFVEIKDFRPGVAANKRTKELSSMSTSTTAHRPPPKAKPAVSTAPIAENRRARFDYFIEERHECGIVLDQYNDFEVGDILESWTREKVV